MLPISADPIRVLVVDDDSQLLKTLSDILRLRGYAPSIASSGREGLEIAGRDPAPAIALVDLKLPDMDGLELVGRLRLLSDLTETVILTGNASIDSAVRALREQSHDYLVKPVAPEQLLVTVSRASERWRRRHVEEELRQAEERSHLLLENISDIVAVVDHDGALSYVSPSLTRRLGYSAERVMAGSVIELIHPDDRDRIAGLLQGTLHDPGSIASVELRIRHANGDWRTLECHITNLQDRPVINGFLVTARDVTESRRLEAQFLQAQKMETVGNLAGGVAHDFNNILTAVIGYSDLVLSRDELDPDVRGEVEEIRSAGYRASRVTRQLLTFSRQQATTPRNVRIESVVGELRHMLGTLAGGHIVFDLRMAPDTPDVRVDPIHLEQVILNLVVNARDAMPQGGTLLIETANCSVDVRTAESPPPGEYVRLTVRDTGSGMPEYVRVRVFEPFFTTKEPGKGTGLGLSTCYGILKQAGGGIAIESVLGEGTAVHTFWPHAPAERPTDPVVAVRSRTLKRGAGRVLIVDDDDGVRRLTASVLRAHGFDVVVAPEGNTALQLLGELVSSNRPPELMLIDLVLPGMSGWQLADQVSSRYPGQRMLFMSGYDRPAAAGERAVARQGVLVKKPFTGTELLSAVLDVLSS